ncbi:hypothetical protein [Agromyces sp. H66]|uniref:hypothetical protein n=1 Tax=Agromyces sp. H66 TaxID=2529859 RepID=UPI001B7D8847|nr:hypothetical protein [Agromyces sp. H66]
MRYTLLLHYAEESPESIGDDVIAEGMRRMSAYAATLHAAEVLVGAEVLQPSASGRPSGGSRPSRGFYRRP